MSKILFLYINNSLATDDNRKLRDFMSAYTFNAQDDGTAMLYVIIKMVRLDTHTWCSDIKYNMENMNISHFKHDTPKAKLQITECMNEIFFAGGKYSEIVRQ